jgi:hypothetical protein
MRKHRGKCLIVLSAYMSHDGDVWFDIACSLVEPTSGALANELRPNKCLVLFRRTDVSVFICVFDAIIKVLDRGPRLSNYVSRCGYPLPHPTLLS